MLTSALVYRGMSQLGGLEHRSGRLLVVSAICGGLGAGAAVWSAYETGAWHLLPAHVVWSCLLIAAGLCDAVTQRIPTVLVRAGTAATAVLFTVAFGVERDWLGLVLTAAASVASVATLLVCWGLLGVGRGDIRLGLLGALGLGGADGRGLLIGLLVLAIVVVGQVVTLHVTGASSRAHIPLGPALAAGFISAATLSAMT